MAPRANDPKTSETTARLILTNKSKDAWLEPISSQKDVDLHIDGKGDGQVFINGSAALTVETLTDLDALADVLANITVDGADPAAVLALQAQVDAIIIELAALAAGALAATPLDVVAVQALIDAALAALPPNVLDEDAVKTLIGDALAAFIMPVLLEHTTDIGSLKTDLASVRTIVVGLVNDLSELPLGAEVQPLLDLLAVKQGATLADVELVWQALSDTSVGFVQLLSTLSGKPISANPTVADVQLGLPVLIQTIVDQGLVDLEAGLPAQITDVALAVVKAWLAVDLNQSNGVVGAYVNGLGQDLAQEIQTRQDQVEGLNFGYKHLRENLVLPAMRAITGDADISVAGSVDAPLAANVGPAMDKIRADIAAALAAVAALEALGVGGGDGTGLTAEQAQMILDTSTDLARIIVGVAGASGTPDDFVNTLGTLALQVRTAQATADTAKADVVKLQTENAALKARLDALEAKTKNLTADGKLSTVNVLGDGFLDSNGGEILTNLQQGLQLLVDALTWGTEGGYGANGQTIETLYDALVAQSFTITTQGEISAYLLQQDEWVNENLAALATYIQEQIAEVTAFSQGIIDAMNGPDATLESILGMFWLLNDVLMALIEATGIEIQGRV